ncbi:DUF4333 domain-containing protein [Streptomyces sp. NPDC015220]|uniref:DUF4333 domain-containing protein n=1 Tax=Streptomyces sp. NPDC015220 TaxID=3364947 RepID=UPI0036F56389
MSRIVEVISASGGRYASSGSDTGTGLFTDTWNECALLSTVPSKRVSVRQAAEDVARRFTRLADLLGSVLDRLGADAHAFRVQVLRARDRLVAARRPGPWIDVAADRLASVVGDRPDGIRKCGVRPREGCGAGPLSQHPRMLGMPIAAISRPESTMPARRLPAPLSALFVLAAGALLVGCSASVHVGDSAPKMSASKLASTLAEKLAATTGQPKPRISCPEDLVGKVGAKTRCTLTADDGSTLGVTVTVSSVKGQRIGFDYQADETPTPAPN